MIEHRIDFGGDWEIWTHVVYKFNIENGYFVFEEVPGWLRATEPLLHNVKLFQDGKRAWAIFYFKREEDLTAFLLRWA